MSEAVSIPAAIWDAMTNLDFLIFLRRVMAEIEPGTEYEENWHIQAIADRLKAVEEGACKRLIINLPPRHMKTIIVSIAFAAWILGHDPTRRIICVTYSHDVAKAQASQFARIVRSPWFQRSFPKCQGVAHNRLTEWQTTEGGYRLATSVEGSVLGRGGDYILLDDPNKGQEIFSEVERKKVQASWDNVISTRLNHPKKSVIICVMQRLHEEDLAGHMMTQEQYEHLVIPAIAPENERWCLASGDVHRRKKGQVIQPSRMGLEELDRQKGIMGGLAFSAQYQQSPVPDDGVVIRRQWLRYYEEEPAEYERTLVSWDTASTLGENSDWSVGTVWGLNQAHVYLIDVIRVKEESPELIKLVEETHRQFAADLTIVEDGDLGRAVVQSLRRTSKFCKPKVYKPRYDKIARMQSRAVMFETGQVLLPREADWLAVYQHELLGFPNTRHDDQVDSTSMALDDFQRYFARRLEAERPAPRRNTEWARPMGVDRRLK
nr:phage terminase large subunit [Parapontixanthobacter aurantiacus]